GHLDSSRRPQTTNQLVPSDAFQYRIWRMLECHPESAGRPMNRKGRAVVHDCHRLRRGARAQSCQKLGQERFEFVELDEYGIVRYLSGRQFDWIARFRKKTTLRLLVAGFLTRQ